MLLGMKDSCTVFAVMQSEAYIRVVVYICLFTFLEL